MNGMEAGESGSAPCANVDARIVSSASSWLPDYLPASAWIEHAPFAFWLIDAVRPSSLVELGTHTGYSYLAFCQAVQQLGFGTACRAVDTWEGDDHAGYYGPEVLEVLRAHHDASFGTFSNLLQLTFDDAQKQFPDGSIDLLHIDGRHGREDVEHDFGTWLPKVSSRGVVLFHDIAVRERGFGVWQVWDRLRKQYPSFQFDHGFGLGVLAVGAEVPPQLEPLFNSEEAAQTARDLYSRLGAAITDRVKIGELAGRASELYADLAAERSRAETLGAELVGERDRITALNETVMQERRAARLLGESFSAELAKERGEKEAAEADAARVRSDYSAVTASRSWRMTGPLRTLVTRLRRIRRR